MIEKFAAIIQSNPTQHENIEHIIDDEYSKKSNIISSILAKECACGHLGAKVVSLYDNKEGVTMNCLIH